MSIARRKAGKVVRCPKCAGEIIVPVPEGTAPPFEEEDFDVRLEVSADVSAPTSVAAMQDPGVQAVVNAPAPAPEPRRHGVFVPMGMLIVSIGVVIMLLILVFVLGLILGRQSAIPV